MSLLVEAFECIWQILDEITGNDALLAEITGSDVTGQSVKVHADNAGVFPPIAPCQESRDNTCQYITAASGSHSCITSGIKHNMTIGQAERGVVTF